MSLKSLIKKLKCKLFFCFGSKCSYNEHGKGKLNIDFAEDNINDNINDEINKIENWHEKIPSNLYQQEEREKF